MLSVLRGPFGTGWPMAEAEGCDVVVVAGGLGLAPLRPALYQLLASADRYGQIVLLYGTRSPNDILFRRELEHVAAAARYRHRGHGRSRGGRLARPCRRRHGADPARRLRPARTPSRMVCGPEVMMRFTIAALRDAGLAEKAIYLSMERNMKCAIGLCGHCQFGPVFVCQDGPVFRYDRVARVCSALKEI